jgi:hypothetical protein
MPNGVRRRINRRVNLLFRNVFDASGQQVKMVPIKSKGLFPITPDGCLLKNPGWPDRQAFVAQNPAAQIFDNGVIGL